MRVILLCIVTILDHIMLTHDLLMMTSQSIQLFVILLDVHFCVHLVITVFKQIGEETIGEIVYLYIEGKSRKFIAENWNN